MTEEQNVDRVGDQPDSYRTTWLSLHRTRRVLSFYFLVVSPL